jgi:long-chain acyl-CoA synthetase
MSVNLEGFSNGYSFGVDSATGINPFLYLERNAEAAPSGVFIESVDQTIRNSDALTYAKKIAYEFRRLGMKPGDVVALDLPESLSILFTEAVFHEAGVSTVLPKGFVADDAFAIDWIFSSAAPTRQRGARVIMVDAQFLQQVEQNPFGITARAYESEKDDLRIVFSSGTTGRPNAIALTLEMLEFHSVNALETWMQGDPFLLFLATSTAMGFNGFYVSVKDDRPFLSVGPAGAGAIVQLAAQNSVTSLKASPAQIADLVDELEARGRTLPHVETVYIVGTVMPPALAARMRQVAEGCKIFNLYGSTEATIAFARYYESDDPFDAGQLFPGARVQIVDEDDQVLPDGQTGRIRHQHPLMVHEYLGNPEATGNNFKDGWFYPGDLGLIRPDKGLTLAGRASEVLNAGGVKIDPTELDLFAVTHPQVVDAASFGYTTSTGLQQVGIALVTDGRLDVQALIREFAGEFGSAAPTLVARVEQIPRNAMGKPMRLTLAEKYKES